MSFPLLLQPLEIWGGLECTLNRVGETYFDQLERNGHLSRPDDLYRFAEVGIRVLRYPIQWERIAPKGVEQANWTWADERLNLLRTLGINPIVGLTHHGSGPRYTSLVEPFFAEKLAQFADAVAQRYPWVEYYTPVNEPLTTARFSGLYGHWYPHGHDNATFVRALLGQCRAVTLSMQAIRRVNPSARLIQTEDLGKTFSTPLLAAQAAWENERRWLTFDLLCGRLDRDCVMWKFLLDSGASEKELDWFLEHPCPPDVLGLDYYLTSERFLDQHLERYPVEFHGTNGQQNYADVEAVRVDTDPPLPLGHYERMKEAWERYHLPLVITEAHLCCTREEQLRWLVQAWRAAERLRQEGGQVRAVTAWCLLGAYDWNNLVTRVTNFYEPGVFDVRGTQPRSTALARLVQTLASGKEPDHPILAQPGWWKRLDRFFYRSYPDSLLVNSAPVPQDEPAGHKRLLLIIGAADGLGKAFARICEVRGLPYQFVSLREIDTNYMLSFHLVLEKLDPWAVLSLIGSDSLEDLTHDIARWDRRQTWQATVIAESCAQRGIPLVAFSSDLVFDGTQQKPYVESDPVTPVCLSGRLQAEMEEQVLRRCPAALLIRTGPLFSPWANFNFLTTSHVLEKQYMSQSVVSPTYVPDMVNACLDLLIDGERGRWHLANRGVLNWNDFTRQVAYSTGRIVTGNLEHQLLTVSQPLASRVLHSKRGEMLPSLDDALTRYLSESKEEQKQPVASNRTAE